MKSVIAILLGCALVTCSLFIVFYLFRILKQLLQQSFQIKQLEQSLAQQQQTTTDARIHHQSDLHQLQSSLQQQAQEQGSAQSQQQMNHIAQLQDSLYKGIKELRLATGDSLERNGKSLELRFQHLQQTTDTHLQRIAEQVETRLQQGFDKTQAVFTDIVKRLAIIDTAQKRITELSSQVVDLQQLLNDKRARGAFGEVQLTHLLKNVLPDNHYSLQHTLSNQQRCDCLLYLPEPTGHIVIDAKFPLETYRKLSEHAASEPQHKSLSTQFQRDIKHHIQTISSKYIIQGETAEGAIMFIPAEAIFAEIHAHHPTLVEYAQKQRIWIASPTTMMGILTTVRAVIKDDATKQQVHVIQKHLYALNKDFKLFQVRMEKLTKHIKMANNDAEDINTSARKISKSFGEIESVQLKEHLEELTE